MYLNTAMPTTPPDNPLIPADFPPLPISDHPNSIVLTGFGFGADPITAGFNAAAAFFSFLSTVQGQRVCNDILNLDEAFAREVHDVWVKIHDRVNR